VAGQTLPTLSPEHSLVFAIVHGTKHTWSRLDLVADVEALFSKDLDDQVVESELMRLGAKRAAAVARAICVKVFEGEGEGEGIAQGIAGRVVAGLMNSHAPTFWQTRAFDISVRERFIDKLRYTVRLGLNAAI
jgi:hypothetical protein